MGPEPMTTPARIPHHGICTHKAGLFSLSASLLIPAWSITQWKVNRNQHVPRKNWLLINRLRFWDRPSVWKEQQGKNPFMKSNSKRAADFLQKIWKISERPIEGFCLGLKRWFLTNFSSWKLTPELNRKPLPQWGGVTGYFWLSVLHIYKNPPRWIECITLFPNVFLFRD